MSLILPSPRQLEYHSWERGLFLHFGIRTFYEGHVDWDRKPMPPEAFNPTELDCRQWVSVAKEAGFKYMVLTAKHHDGFLNFPSEYSDYTVAATPWKNGKGDVVREFVDACREGDMKIGLYYSPADWYNPDFGTNPEAFDRYFLGQLRELLTNYGEIDILWFDGCGSEKHKYNWELIVSEIRRLQPNVLMFNMGDPDFRWVGNEAGYTPLGNSNVVDTVPISVRTTDTDSVQKRWLPAECDFRMRERNWFYSDQDEHTVKTVDELISRYYYSCGRGANMLINIGPDRRGLLPDKDAQRLIEFGREIERRFGDPSVTIEDTVREGNLWRYRSEGKKLIDHVRLGEDIAQGERVTRFAIKANPPGCGTPITVFEGYRIGYQFICEFPLIEIGTLTVEIIESDADPILNRIDMFYVGR